MILMIKEYGIKYVFVESGRLSVELKCKNIGLNLNDYPTANFWYELSWGAGGDDKYDFAHYSFGDTLGEAIKNCLNYFQSAVRNQQPNHVSAAKDAGIYQKLMGDENMTSQLPETVTVFNTTCSRVTSDEELDDLGHYVTIVKEQGIVVYANLTDNSIIEASLNNNEWQVDVTFADDNANSENVCGEHCDTLKEAEEDVLYRLETKMKTLQRMYALVNNK
jgi:hypothetical protein